MFAAVAEEDAVVTQFPRKPFQNLDGVEWIVGEFIDKSSVRHAAVHNRTIIWHISTSII